LKFTPAAMAGDATARAVAQARAAKAVRKVFVLMCSLP
jgi:hypothetical protein